MKKIFTLMAAMSAVSSAFAYDYNWKGIEKPEVDKNTGFVTNCDGLKYLKDTNEFNFEVQEKDSVSLHVKGNNISVSLAGSDLETTTENGVIKFQATIGGTVTIKVGSNTSITQIKVVSDLTVQLNTLIKNARENYKQALQETSTYAAIKNGEFFDKLRNGVDGFKGINGYGKDIEKIVADFKKAQEENKVADNFEVWKAELQTNIPAALTDLVSTAKKCKEKYDAVLAFAEPTRVAIAVYGTNVPKNKDVKTDALAKDYNNNINSIYNFEANKDGDNKAATKVGPKTSWIENEYKAYADKAMSAVENAAYAELCEKFPELITTDYKTEYYDQAVTALENMIGRAIVEGEKNLNYKKKIETLDKNVAGVEKVLAQGEPFTLPKEDNLDYMTLVERVQSLVAFVTSTDYYQVSLAEMKDMLESSETGYNQCLSVYKQINAKFVEQAQKALNDEIKKVQDKISDYSYKVAAKYENEKDTQLKYQKRFAALQNKLDSVKAIVDAGKFADVVTKYSTQLTGIKNITPEVEALWNETLSDQVISVKENNTAIQNELNKSIEEFRADVFDKYVDKIVNWKQADATKDVATTLDVNLKNLFNIILGLDKQKENIQKYMDQLQRAIDDADQAEFDPNNNIYRFTQEKKTEFEKAIALTKSKVDTEIKKAVYTANLQAAKYLLNDYDAQTQKDKNTIYDAKEYIVWKASYTYEQANLYAGKDYEKLSKDAQAKYIKAYKTLAYNEVTEDGAKVEKGLLGMAKIEINKHHLDAEAKTEEEKSAAIQAQDLSQMTLADIVKTIQNDYIAKVYTEAGKLDVELESYKKQYTLLGAMKVTWTETKAKQDYYQKVADEISEGELNVKGTLDELNTKVGKALKDLEGACTKASKKEGNTDAVKTTFDEEIFRIVNFETFKKNEATAKIANARVTEVAKVIADAREAVKDYKDEAKDKANASFEAADKQLESIKKKIEKAVEDRNIDAEYNKEGGLKVDLDNVVKEVNAALAQAKKDNESVDADYNGDGKVDFQDARDLQDDFQSGKIDSATFSNFFDAYLKSI